MMDKVNIIENLEELEWFLLREYEQAKDDIDTWYFRYHAVSDARELLKEQENDIHHMGLIIEEYEKELKKQNAVKPHYNARTNWYECGACHYSMTSGMHCRGELIPAYKVGFCAKCGKKQEWK